MKKMFLMLCLSIGATTFASTGNKSAKKSLILREKIIVVYNCSTSCDGVTFTYQAGSYKEAAAIASRYCSGGVIAITQA